MVIPQILFIFPSARFDKPANFDKINVTK